MHPGAAGANQHIYFLEFEGQSSNLNYDLKANKGGIVVVPLLLE